MKIWTSLRCSASRTKSLNLAKALPFLPLYLPSSKSGHELDHQELERGQRGDVLALARQLDRLAPASRRDPWRVRFGGWPMLLVDLVVVEELVGRLGQVAGGGLGDADHHGVLAELADGVDQRDEVAVAGDQHVGLDVRIGVERLHHVDAQVHVDAVLDRPAGAALVAVVVVGRHVDRLDAVGVQRVRDARVAVPVGVGAGDRHAPVALTRGP